MPTQPVASISPLPLMYEWGAGSSQGSPVRGEAVAPLPGPPEGLVAGLTLAEVQQGGP